MSKKEFHSDIYNISDTSSGINDVVLGTLCQNDITHRGKGKHNMSNENIDLLRIKNIKSAKYV